MGKRAAATEKGLSYKTLIQQITRRAERHDRAALKGTFVEIGGITSAVQNRDHKIILGRRGTGKTHALLFMQETVRERGAIGVFIDLRVLGSDTSVYEIASIPIEQRAVRLLIDFVAAIREGIIEECNRNGSSIRIADAAESLNDFAEVIYNVDIDGEVEQEVESGQKAAKSENVDLSIEIAKTAAKGGFGVLRSTFSEESEKRRKIARGVQRYRAHFDTLRRSLDRVTRDLNVDVWLFVDEWSAVPAELQPYLADMIRRAIFPLNRIIAIIAAIEHRANFQIPLENGYLGIELGADASSTINLDDFMVFENDPERSKTFFAQLIYKHCLGLKAESIDGFPRDEKALIKKIFATQLAFDEFVKAAEGVPRDAINILNRASQRAGSSNIAVKHVRSAARDWFQQDKSAFLKENNEADFFLRWLIDKVIGQRKARAFLVRSDHRSRVLESLYDHRLIHLLKRSISAHDEVGVRYVAYKLDYGCYVDLISTKKAPEGLFLGGGDEEEVSAFVDVPPDDYRSIRRSILNIDEFDFEHLKKVLTEGKLPAGPLSIDLKYDVSLARILDVLFTSRARPRKSSQLDLFSSKEEALDERKE